MVKLHNPNAYDMQKWNGVASNSLDITSSDLVTKTGGLVTKTGAGDDIKGLSYEKKVFASDNQTVAQDRLQYVVLGEKDFFEVEVDGTALTYAKEGIAYDLTAEQKLDVATEGVGTQVVVQEVKAEGTIAVCSVA